ncbi:hypothetical protein [Pseudomonas syringae]|uniref:hypothetical protein n=1 Tax=Pseudomonas syringae TaxID=317 RepID=UPI001F110E80|nr:hypothetical protein [Pseudomonas syringae]MCH5583111.1 hypothetical protein [Pseudomonas syringae pv. syringae]MCH5592790.1 hypothetical protein [Pseudomonas syringae pv. syringae]MDF5791041.1 hypothetical protein [Pseudomonas syringae pv. syringae]
MKRSTGFRNAMLATGAVPALNGKVIKIFSGTSLPVSADEALPVGTTLLCTVSVNDTGTGLTFSAPSGGQITKSTAEIWSGTVLASGTASFFRMEDAADAGASSTTAIRIQGTIGLDGADMNFGNTALVSGNIRQINLFVISVSAG